jgi:hypothetical protein
MSNIRPFWRAIERERVGSGRSLRIRRESLYRRRLALQAEARSEHRKRSTVAKPQQLRGVNLWTRIKNRIGAFFNGKKSK